ncbi:YadA-like family protein [Brevundimonas faecalis]|uniref:Autotransporter adhesin n=1 Tax=Brevundimonas faecalis TaxID=947378 RepID=A0ABV2R7N4_9CAUL
MILGLGVAGTAQAQNVGPGTTLSLPCAANFDSTACGAVSAATGENSTAIGAASEASALDSVALGTLSLADREHTVSVGRVGDERQIVNVSNGTEATDAVNLGQMEAGDAATLADANAYADRVANNAFLIAASYTDTREAEIRRGMVAGDAATLADANTYTDTRETAIRTDMAAGDAVTLAAANTYADAGDAATLASANTYADAGDIRTLASANAYADGVGARALGQANDYTDAQTALLWQGLGDARVRADAGTASAIAAANIPQPFQPGGSTVGAAVGYWRGESALAIGASHLMSSGRVTLRGSANFSRGGGSGGGVGIGFNF